MSIVVENLTKQYGTQLAIDSIGFELKPGQILGFLGPNGAGKSTTMKIITCFIPPTSGNVRLDKFNVLEHPLEIRRRIGYLPEHNPLYLDMYVVEFLRFVAELYNLPAKNVGKRVEAMIELTGLGRERHKKIGMLSKGYRQRVGLAQALIHDPEVLILDEPTTGLDPNQVVEIRNVIKEAGQTKTVMFSSHILSEVAAIADRVMIINKGKLIADTSIAGLNEQFAPESLIKIEFEKPHFNFEAIRALPEVAKIEKLSPTLFNIQTKGGADIHKLLYDQSMEQNNSILTMNKTESSLEDIFRKITG